MFVSAKHRSMLSRLVCFQVIDSLNGSGVGAWSRDRLFFNGFDREHYMRIFSYIISPADRSKF